jgi:hypothetical protein
MAMSGNLIGLVVPVRLGVLGRFGQFMGHFTVVVMRDVLLGFP